MKNLRFLQLLLAVLFSAALVFSSCSVAVADPDYSTDTSSEISSAEGRSVEDPSPESLDSDNPSDNSPSDSSDGPSSVEIESPDTPTAIPEGSSFTIYFLDVGQGDGAVVECDGNYMLIDGGNAGCSSLLYSFLEKRGITYLEYVIGTHKHEDHIGGIPGALSYAEAGKVFCSETEGETKAFNNFVKAVKKQELTISVPEAGDSFELGSAKVEILGPIDYNTDDTNQLSIVLKITYGETGFLFTGDAGREEEKSILAAGYDLNSDVLKVGHHGSNSSSTYPFIREIMPKYAVISIGKNNDYGHPTDDILSRLRDAGLTVYRTDLHGDVICRSDGTSVTFETQKNIAP